MKTYTEFRNELLDWYRTTRPNSGLPSEIVINILYNDYLKKQIMNYFYNKRDKSVLLQQGIFQIVLYFTKDWLGFNFNRTHSGWYFRLRFCKLGFNLFYK